MELDLKRARLNRKLRLIFALNIVDWLCSVVLLRTERFYEANPLMRQVFGNGSAEFALKFIFPALVILIVSAAMMFLDKEDLCIADRFISFVAVFYAVIDLDHIINFILLVFQNFS